MPAPAGNEQQLQMPQQTVGGADDAAVPSGPPDRQDDEQQHHPDDRARYRDTQGADRELADQLAAEQHDETGDHDFPPGRLRRRSGRH